MTNRADQNWPNEMITEINQDAGKYIGRIRNANKREYANNYSNWILNGRQGAEPDRRYLLNGTLS